jgi:hypothetical protein
MNEHNDFTRGPQGEAGPAGRQGESGTTGREGREGTTGRTGEPGKRGAQGDQPKLRWAPMVGYALLALILLGLLLWAFAAQADIDRLDRRVDRLQTDVSLLRE